MDKKIKFCLIIAIFVVIIFGVVFYKFEISGKSYSVFYNIEQLKDEYNSVFGNVHENVEIGQTFISRANNLSIIYINFYKSQDTYERNSTGGNAIIGLQDSLGNIIKEELISYNYIRTNNNYKFEFEKQKDSKDKKYYFYIKFLNLEKNYDKWFSVIYSKNDVYKDGSMYVNGEKIDGDLYFEEQYYNINKTILFIIYTIIFIIIFVYLVLFIYKSKNLTHERLFLYVVPAMFALFLICTPTLKNHDEPFHWYRIYDIAQGNLFTKMINGEPKADAPREIYDMELYDNTKDLVYSDLIKQYAYQITENSNHVYITLSTTAIYNPIQYLPQVIGTFISSKLTDRPIIMAYCARITNMIITACILYLSIIIIPYGKKILLLLMCIPISVEGFTSMSPDALTISIAFLFVAYVLKLFNEKEIKITLKDKIVLLCMAIVLSLCKIVYLPIVGLLLILPKDKFKTRKEQMITIGGIIGIATLINISWLIVSASYLVTFRDGDSKIQLAYILQHPIKYIEMLLYTLNIETGKYFYSMFGGELGWDEYMQTYSCVPAILGVLYVFFASTEKDIKDIFNLYQKVIIWLIILAIVFLIFTSLYIQWSPVENTVITGVQGRYFIPILPLVAFSMLNNFKVKNDYKEEYKLKMIGITLLLTYLYVFLSIIVENI